MSSFRLSVRLFARSSFVCLFVCPSSVRSCVRPSVRPSVCPCVRPSVRPSSFRPPSVHRPSSVRPPSVLRPSFVRPPSVLRPSSVRPPSVRLKWLQQLWNLQKWRRLPISPWNCFCVFEIWLFSLKMTLFNILCPIQLRNPRTLQEIFKINLKNPRTPFAPWVMSVGVNKSHLISPNFWSLQDDSCRNSLITACLL